MEFPANRLFIGLSLMVILGATACGDDNAKTCTRGLNFNTCEAAEGPGLCLGGTCTPLVSCSGTCENALHFSLPDTGLAECYKDSPDGSDGAIECPGVPDSGSCESTPWCGQDAQYGWDTDHTAAERFTVSGETEPLVTDSVTGLTWQLCSMGQTGNTCDGTATLSTWYEARDFCENATWGGHDDWSLPNRYQLQSIVDYGKTGPAIDRSVFVNSPSRFQQIYDMWWIECVWSATDYAGDSSVAWALMVNSGDISEGSGLEYHSHDKDAVGWDGCYARCVRRSDTTDTHSRFVAAEPVSGEPIVGDRVTGLIWQGCSAGQSGADCSGDAEFIDWASALAYCQSLTWGGYNDWRLPNIREISSIIDGSRTLPAINTGVFPGTPYYGPVTNNNAGQYWSSTARSYNSFALYADFTFGFTHFYEQPEGRHVRCVH